MSLVPLALLLASTTTCNASNGFTPWHQQPEYEYFIYATCPNIDCKVSIFEYCAAASIGRLFEEYLVINGFEHEASRKEKNPNTKLRVRLTKDTESIFCSGLFIQRSLLSLMNTQNTKTTKHAIDLISLLEKTELHKAVHGYSFWPESYWMGNDAERRQFLQQLPCNTHLSEPWLFKTNEHKGKGIIFLENTSDIRKLFITNSDLKHGFDTSDDRLTHNCNRTQQVQRFELDRIYEFGFSEQHIVNVANIIKGEHFIAQRFVNDTVLISGRKFGIRVFVTILSLNPYIVLYSDGYISINMQQFDDSNINKENILSNREMSEKYANFEGEWNWNFVEFGNYIQRMEDSTFNGDDVRNNLFNAARDTFNAIDRDSGKFSKKTRKKLKKYIPLAKKQGLLSKDDNNYLWLAMDFLLQTNGNVKLLEINLHPGTRLFDGCSWNDATQREYFESFDDWRCMQSRNITKEIVDVSFAIAYRKRMNLPVSKKWLEQQIQYHQCLIFKDY